MIEYEECQDTPFPKIKKPGREVMTLEFYSNDEEPEIRTDTLYTQNIDENPDKPGVTDENARTTTEEDITMLSRPVYNFVHPLNSEADIQKYTGAKIQQSSYESMGYLKRTAGNTGTFELGFMKTKFRFLEDSREAYGEFQPNHPRLVF